jgi:hypothetical protein
MSLDTTGGKSREKLIIAVDVIVEAVDKDKNGFGGGIRL